MYNGKTVSVVTSTYREKDSIRKCVEDFFATGYVDEFVVVNNNAAPGTDDEVLATRAKLVHESKQGYGFGFQRALAESTGDLIVMVEPDGTFDARDLIKLLVYAEDMDVVQGSRTNATTILSNANMGMALKYGNYFVAKLAEFSYFGSSPSLSDCGCTYRVFRRKAYEHIRPFFREGGSAFGFELSLLVLRSDMKMCQIPVHYGERVGVSAVTGSFLKTCILGAQMVGLIVNHRVEECFRPVTKFNTHV